MKERPIIFTAPMVRALLAGRKTQTRRIAPIEHLDIQAHDDGMTTWRVGFTKAVKGVCASYSGGQFSDSQARSIIASQFNPFGQPGELLWVRECWQRDDEDGALFYRADVGLGGEADDVERNRIEGSPFRTWRPSIHMPRRASRITLEITGVSVERLQDINEVDALWEGVTPIRINTAFGGYLEGYRALWESIYGPGSWDANPWVWKIEFRRVEP